MLSVALALVIMASPEGGTSGTRMGLVTGGAGPGSTSGTVRPGSVGVGDIPRAVDLAEPGVSDKTVAVIFSFAAATALTGLTLWLLSPLDDDAEDEDDLDVIPVLGLDAGSVGAGLRLGF